MITRTVEVDAKWDCVSSKNYVSKLHLVKVNIKDSYEDDPSEDLTSWSQRVSNEVTMMMCKRACGSLSDSIYCNDIYPYVYVPKEFGKSLSMIIDEIKLYEEKRQKDLIKRQEKKEKVEQKRKIQIEKIKEKIKIEKIEIPVIIDEESTSLIMKKELMPIDIIQISRLEKSINKLEKKKEELVKNLNISLGAIKRLEESRKFDFIFHQIVVRDRWLDNINLTERKIEKQKASIEKIKISKGL